MSANTPEEFEDVLNQAFGWRRIEIHALKSEVESIRTNDLHKPRPRMILRASVALLYAHWEGFVKQACQYYLDYVGKRRLRVKELNVGLAATALRPMLESCLKDSVPLIGLAGDLDTLGERRSQLSRTVSIDTGGNLRYRRLAEILELLGLSVDFSTREAFIDKRLCDARNQIAHGEFSIPDVASVLELFSDVLEMMDELRTELMNSVSQGSYRRVPGTPNAVTRV